MDGNGRWAKARGHNRLFGHVRGAKVAKSIIEECARRKLECLTLFTFSTENWNRPRDEVRFLMHLLARRLRKEKASLLDNNIRFSVIGDLSRLPGYVQEIVMQTVADTSHCTGMRLIFALSYGGRQDLVSATKKVAAAVKAGHLDVDQINEDVVRQFLETRQVPDPDLIIRTSGESRLSNFYLWQAAYSEIYITEKLWPDFTLADLSIAVQHFGTKERRFGLTSDQLLKEPAGLSPI